MTRGLYVSYISAVVLSVVCLALSVAVVSAQSAAGVAFPISELGSCQDKQACHAYCEMEEHHDACAAFAKAHGLAPKEEQERADKLSLALKSGGPGGCTTRTECKAYCDAVAHLDECKQFAADHQLAPQAEQDSGDKIARALKQGVVLPGNCQNRQECQAYCQDETHKDECIAFGRKAGLLPPNNPSGDVPPAPRMPISTGELRTCLTQSLGNLTIQELESGITRPDALMQQRIKSCITKFRPVNPENAGKSLQLPPVLLACLTEKLGAEKIAQIQSSGLTNDEALRGAMAVCGPMMKEGSSSDSNEPEAGILPVPQASQQPMMFRTNAETKACLEKLYGPDVFEQMQQGAPTAEMKARIGACLGVSPTDEPLQPAE